MTARHDWQPGDFATFPDSRRGPDRTGIYTGETRVSTTRLTALGEEVTRKVPVTYAMILVTPAGGLDHPGRGAGSVSVDVRKLRPATPAEITASDVRQGWATCQARAAAAAAWWEAATPAVTYLIEAGYADGHGQMGMAIVNLLLEADRYPGRYAYTLDRRHWVVKYMPARWNAGATHPADPALRATAGGAR
jgi:hypothetical protein